MRWPALWPTTLLLSGALATVVLPDRNMIRLAYDDLWSGRAAAYATAERCRAELTMRARSDDVAVSSLGVVSHLLAPIVRRTEFGEDVLAAAPEQWWGNNLYATFYGKRTLRLISAYEDTHEHGCVD
jgi:hypothetical protein